MSGARRRLGRPLVLVTLLSVAVLIAVLDQLSKNWAEANLPLLDPQPLLGEVLQLTLLYNSGAAWGMGSGATPVVTALQIAIAVGVIAYAITSVRSRGYALALGLVLGGALGNIHDRLLRPPGIFHGHVVDFLQLPNWPVFNVADMAVVGGAILIVAFALFGVPADPARAEAAAGEDAGAVPESGGEAAADSAGESPAEETRA